ncbi:c2 domain-containing protein [Stemphylium lycopersici]|uniref:C2 domain-containing protein n=1 Tax=Stemphylium lycopersici TaxID=183478 RepID=A0A364N103_STELY|nr:c2 domain-containing protein [Stemphylium lycopersici]RAR05500.1 c2 domain-containing protein [Stemphylium lycopersici]RAR09167.1 c2 domain-containing protein [Stemphylium lycopersici]
MATKAMHTPAFGGAHAAGIFSDMTVDGPVIGTLVVIMDRARNLPNKRTMGKQDPYCAARLGKEAKKTKTDKRGGQTPKWDQELRFTVHDSPDYNRLKVSVFNDDKKTELIGEAYANLHSVITPGGGQSDEWLGLNCKGKYAGEIRMEITYYDTRPKADNPVPEKKRISTKPEGQAAVGGAREMTPVKRRPLPSDPTGATPSPVHTPEHRGLRGVRAGPRELGSPRHQQPPAETPPSHRSQSDAPGRRPVPDSSPLAPTPTSNNSTPQRPMPHSSYSTPPNPRSSNQRIAMPREESFDMSYAAPKPYEVKPIDPLPQHMRHPEPRRLSQEDGRPPRSQQQPQHPAEPIHSHSAPVVPTQHSYEPPAQQQQIQDQQKHIEYLQQQLLQHQQPVRVEQPQQPPPAHVQDQYQDPAYQVAPLRSSRSRDYGQDQAPPLDQYYGQRFIEAPPPQEDSPTHRRRSAMQPMVEDEDDMPPPPPMHKRNASTLPHPHQESQDRYQNEAPAPLSFAGRSREDSRRISFDAPVQQYEHADYAPRQPSERRYTHPRMPTQPSSRPVSRDTMVPSPLRQEPLRQEPLRQDPVRVEIPALPSSLVPGLSPVRQEIEAPPYDAPPSYEPTPRLRHYSEPAEYRAITQFEAPVQSQELVHHSAYQTNDYYPHDPPEQPRQRSPPVYDVAPIVKPRATSPNVNSRYSPHPVQDRYSPNSDMDRYSPNPVTERSSRLPARSMPTRKSVSPRPPPPGEDFGERRLSGIAFNPDSFDVYNPRVSKSPIPSDDEPERPGSRMEYNDKGQIVTFSGRVVDASDHLPIDNWAPEPVPKGTVKEKAPRSRPQLNGSRDLEAAMQREERYQRERADRERIRHAASMNFDNSNALVTTRHDFNDYNSSVNAGALVLANQHPTQHSSAGRSRPQRRDQQPRPVSAYDSVPQYNLPDRQVLRERENPNSYGSNPGYGSRGTQRHSVAAPPIPAKVPIDMGGASYGSQNDEMALSLELQSIDIGPGSGARRPRAARRQYGF